MTRKGRTAAGTKRKVAVWLVVLAMMVSLGAGTMAVMADADPVPGDPAAAAVTETASPAEEGAAEEAAGTEEGAAEDQALTDEEVPAATEEAAQETDENSTAGEQEQSGDAVESPAHESEEWIADKQDDPASQKTYYNSTYTLINGATGKELSGAELSATSVHGEWRNVDNDSSIGTGDWRASDTGATCAPFGNGTYQTTRITPPAKLSQPIEFKVSLGENGEPVVEMLNGTEGKVDVTLDEENASYQLTITLPGNELKPGNPPATVTTVDHIKDGFTVNLFDYDLGDDRNSGDTWNNSPTSDLVGGWPTGGINASSNLKFFGHGGEPTLENGNSNLYTGDYIARQGIVQPLLGENGYPVMTEHGQQNLALLFSTDSNDNKKVYQNVNHLFQKNEAGNYYFDSDENYAFYDPTQGDNGDFKVYDGTYKVYETSQDGSTMTGEPSTPVGYFPFDDWNENKTDVAPALDTAFPYNHQHGLTLEGAFQLPENGTADGKDVIFHFSGDDDAWLFVDGVLVLDIGGLHRPVGGSVNFTNGKVQVDAAVDMAPWNGNAPNPQTIGTNNTLTQIFAAAGKTWDPKAKHEFKFFYLERGGCYSNLALETNIWKVAGVKVDAEKVWEDAEEVDHSKDSVEVQLMAKSGDETEAKPVEGKTLTLDASNDWKDSFTNLPAEDEQGNKIEYSVKETPVPGYKATYEQGGTATKDNTYWVPADPSRLENGKKYAIIQNNWMSSQHEPRILTAQGTSVITQEAEVKDQVVPGEKETLKDDTGSYTQILAEDPSAEQQFTAIDNGNGTWSFRNGSNNVALRGQGGYWGNYSFLMSGQNGWDGQANFQNQFRMMPIGGGNGAAARMCAVMQWWNGYGFDEYWGYMLLNNGTNPGATNNFDWAGQFTFWKKVEVESEIDLPDYWTITNTPKGNGNLEITKTLPVKEDSSPATFVFSVKATFRGETVYDDIVTLTFDKAGSQTAKIEGKIPADAEVEVKEIYGGAAYSVQGDDTVNVTVLSNDDASAPVTAAFENTYNSKELTSGYGVLNTYTMGDDARWIVNGEPQGEQPEDKN